MRPSLSFAPPLLALLTLLAGCGAADAPGDAPGAGARTAADASGARGGAEPVGVVVAVVERRPFPQEIEALGNARANEAVDVTAKIANTIAAIRFVEGQPVRAGEVLVELDGAQARAELAAAEAAVVESRAQAERSRALAVTAALSRAQVDQIEATLKANEARVAAARAKLADTVIRAPFAGRTGLRRVSLGGLVNPGTVITTLDDTSVIKLEFAVPETFVSLVAVGAPLTARGVAYPDAEFEGRVANVDSRIDPATRSVLVRAAIPNRDGRLKPGMFMSVRLRRDTQPVLTMPESAVVPEQGRTFAFVVADGVAAKREVQLGRRRPGEIEIVSGLAAGERVVTEGSLKIRDGVPVREVAAAQSTAPAGAAAAQPAP